MSKDSQIAKLERGLKVAEKGLKHDNELAANGKQLVELHKSHGMVDHGNPGDADDLAYYTHMLHDREKLVLVKRQQIFKIKQQLSRLGVTATELRRKGL